MKQLIQKYQVGGFIYNPEVSKKTRKLIFDKNGIRYDIWQASRELENSGLGLGYNDLYNQIPRQKYPNRFQPIIDFFKSLPEIKTVHSSAGFGTKNNTSDSNSEIKQSSSVNQIKKQNTKSNNKQKLNPNLHKKGGIIKAAQGWRINNNRLIVTHGGTDFFVDPEAFTVDDEGFSNAAYIDSKGNKRYFRLTVHDINRLKQLGVNYKSGKKIIKSTYNPNNFSNSSTDEVVKSVESSQPAQPVPSAVQPVSPDYSGIMDFIYQQVPWLKGFNPREGGTYKFSNGQWSEVQNGSVKAPTETEIPDKIAGQPTAPTYESLVQANTAAFNNGINSAYWRKNFRKSFNNALLSGNMYGVDENGTQVFDINGITASDIIGNYGIFDSQKGLTRRGMRQLMKQQKFNNAGIFANAQQKVKSLNASPAQTDLSVINDQEPVVATINGQVANNVNSFGFDKANYYPNTQNGFNGTSDIDSNAAYRAEQEKRNAINLQNRS